MSFLPSRETQGYAYWWTENEIFADSWNLSKCYFFLQYVARKIDFSWIV